jgi:hypothetical protein
MIKRFSALLLGALLIAPAARAGCLLPGQTPMLLVTLYFGETIPGTAPVTPQQWADFTAHTITPAFPDGFTVTDGAGQWRNPQTGVTDQDPTKILTVALTPSQTLPSKVAHVMQAYETQFHQQAVGVTSAEVCASFNQ